MASFATAPGGRGIAGRVFGPIISLPAIKHTATVIMLHGLVSMYLVSIHLLSHPSGVSKPYASRSRAGGYRKRVGSCGRRTWSFPREMVS